MILQEEKNEKEFSFTIFKTKNVYECHSSILFFKALFSSRLFIILLFYDTEHFIRSANER